MILGPHGVRTRAKNHSHYIGGLDTPRLILGHLSAKMVDRFAVVRRVFRGGIISLDKSHDWPQPNRVVLNVMTPWITEVETASVSTTLESGWIGSAGSAVLNFEESLTEYLDQPTISVANGSVALLLALTALDIGHGNEVVVPAFSYAATASSVVRVGATPIFCDVRLDSWQLDHDLLPNLITSRTKAVILPHSYGVAGDINKIREICDRAQIFLIEDVAEAFSGKNSGQMLGTFGHVATFSFFPNKLITTGEGGAVSTSDGRLLDRLKLLRGQGMSADRRYWFLEPGFNFRMSSLQAALGIAQMKRVAEIHEIRASVEEAYFARLKDHFDIPLCNPGDERAPWIFSARLRVEDSNSKIRRVAGILAEHGFETRPLFYSLPTMPAFAGYKSGETPVANRLARFGISLPSSHLVDKRHLDQICNLIEGGLNNAL